MARTAVSLVLVAALLCLVFLVQSHIDDTFGEYRATEEILYVDDAKVLKKVMRGFENLAADVYWLRVVQYFGGKRREVTNKNYDLLEPLLEITVTLDPRFRVAYTYGSTFLSEPFPLGAGQPLKAIELVDRGIQNHPEYWRFYLDKGFIYFWYLEDYEKAAEVFLEGSKIEGAPFWMATTAGRTLTQSGQRDTARGLWRIIHDSAETEQQRENAALHLTQLDALDQMDALRRLVRVFEERVGRYP
ncbi:MAG: tetratricopeptide repeat protein, partial [Vicinamibacteria bacterium]